jgi:hypothetical protein
MCQKLSDNILRNSKLNRDTVSLKRPREGSCQCAKQAKKSRHMLFDVGSQRSEGESNNTRRYVRTISV